MDSQALESMMVDQSAFELGMALAPYPKFNFGLLWKLGLRDTESMQRFVALVMTKVVNIFGTNFDSTFKLMKKHNCATFDEFAFLIRSKNFKTVEDYLRFLQGELNDNGPDACRGECDDKCPGCGDSLDNIADNSDVGPTDE